MAEGPARSRSSTLDRLKSTASRVVIYKSFPAEVAPAPDAPEGTFRFTISTDGVDRERDVIEPAGWHVDNFLRAGGPVLWAHDYSALPVGRTLELVRTEHGLSATMQFADAETYAFADTVRRLVLGGFLSATSVGFAPVKWAYNEDRRGVDFAEQELLEFSIVPVPANPDCLIEARAAGIDVEPLREWAAKTLERLGHSDQGVLRVSSGTASTSSSRIVPIPFFYAMAKGVTPASPSGAGKADEATAWAAPTLGDFTDKAWGDLSETERSAIARHFAWAKEMPPVAFGDLKLPHHRASDGATVWNGVRSAMGALLGARGGVDVPSSDRRAIYDHLKGHYGDFAKDAPEFRDAAPDECPMADECPMRNGGKSVAKRGRVLSAANEAKLRQAGTLIGEVVAQVETEPEVDATAETSSSRRLAADPLRWNRQLSRAFDVASERVPAASLEYDWVGRYIGVETRELRQGGTFVPSFRMGAFLAALDETLSSWRVDAIRNLTGAGSEAPPYYETVRLNSSKSGEFLVNGLRFMTRHDGVKAVLKVTPDWGGLDVTTYVPRAQAEAIGDLLRLTWERARQLNFLKGEAFSLGGEFLERTGEGWGDLFLEPADLAPLQRVAAQLGERGAALDSRGILLMGPPGTGKTLAGRVLMSQAASSTFIWLAARDFYRSGAFGGIADAFDLAEECAPTILFIEDIDSWLDSYSVDLLKTEMDGIKRRSGVVTVLTTNYPHRLSEALIDRPGRFHDVLQLGLPSASVRQAMLNAWLPDIDAATRDEIAAETAGFSGAHLRELAKFATTLREESPTLSLADAVREALGKIRSQRAVIDAARQVARAYTPNKALALAVRRGSVLKRTDVVLDHDAIVESMMSIVDIDDEVDTGLEVIDVEAIPYYEERGSGALDDLTANDVLDALKTSITTEAEAGVRRVLNAALGRVD